HLPPTAGPSRVTSDAVIVASGGARGVTAAALLALAKAHRPRLVLLGRTRTEPEPAGLEGADDEPSLVRLLAEREAEREEGRSPSALAARALTDLSVPAAVALADDCAVRDEAPGPVPAYERWRGALSTRLGPRTHDRT
ncbi:hypothetical protein GA0115246_112989, partial [Streptomyces sp. SolWspMP-sol7th]